MRPSAGSGSLNIEMRLKRGRGYVSAEFNNDEDLSVGYIPIDSVHTPIKKVNYTSIRPVRVRTPSLTS
jgi:DNA-directed RNA polymerase alpha subunit